MRLRAPFRTVGDHIAVDLPGARATFTTRRGGYSGGPYATLNLGRWTEDDPDAVERNRSALAERLGVRLVHGRQVHGAVVALVREIPDQAAPPTPADGQATARRRIAPMVLTADCLPIALAGGGAVAMLHAGWRGLVAGVVEEGVRAVRELSDGGSLAAAIGPGAGPCCYEVGDEVHARFQSYGSGVRRGASLDLKRIAALQLERAGVVNVHDVQLCTICSDSTLFFSHRRDGPVTGRQSGVVWLT